MATASQQRRWRQRDKKKAIQVRLDPAAVERLARLVEREGKAGRGEVLEHLVLATDNESPVWLAHEGVRMARGYFRAAGAQNITLRDSGGWLFTVNRHRPNR